MKKKKVILITAAVILAIVIAVAAILLLKSDMFGMTKAQRNKPVATVGGTETVTASEFAIGFQNYYGNIDMYNQYAMYYGVGSYHDVSTPEGVEALRKEILDDLVSQRAYVALAKKYGITLTDEEKKQAAEAGKASYESLVSQYTEQYARSGNADAKNYAMTSVAEYISKSGIGSKAEFIRRNTYNEEAAKLQTKVVEKLKADSGITAEQAEELYPDWASYYEGFYSEGYVSQFDQYFIEGAQKMRYPYIPEDFVFVRVIELSDKDRAEALAAEIGTDAEIFEKYCGNKDSKSEENLDKLMPLVAADDSYAIGANDSSFHPSVYEDVAAMNVGDIKLINVTSEASEEEGTAEAEEPYSAFYIIRRVEGTTGIVPFEKIKDTVAEDVVSNAQSEAAAKAVSDWIAEEGNVVIDDDVYAMVRDAA